MRAVQHILALTILAQSAGTCVARAEFQLAGPSAAMAAQPAPTLPEPADPPLRPTAPARTGPGVAQGFGHQVPLAFAVRQIVPASVKVRFSSGVDPEDLLVDWKGGRPWPDVLRSTLRPPGLLVTFQPGAVLIERASPS